MSSDRLWIEDFTLFNWPITTVLVALIIIIGTIVGVVISRQKNTENAKKR